MTSDAALSFGFNSAEGATPCGIWKILDKMNIFDVVADILSPVAYRRLTSGWQHVFRQAILKLMPAGKLAEHFDPQMGRPTKELYSMAGLLFIMEFRNWTHEEAADAYMFNIDSQYALNLPPEKQSLCRRTIEGDIRGITVPSTFTGDLDMLCSHGDSRPFWTTVPPTFTGGF